MSTTIRGTSHNSKVEFPLMLIFRNVILRAIIDAHGLPGQERKLARQWAEEKSKDFLLVCHLAEIAPTEAYRLILESDNDYLNRHCQDVNSGKKSVYKKMVHK